MTTDRKTFWRHRTLLASFGVQVMRPSELLEFYLPYWQLLDDEFRKRG